MTWNLIGHAWAARLLEQHIRSGGVRHAYLFAGPRGVGRRTLALRFAQALTCEQSPTPCLSCPSCRRWETGQHPDLMVVQAEQEGGTLKVDQVRAMQHVLALAPYQAAYRIALLLRFEEAHPSAANALLKTLEEPPPHVILLLTAESPEQLLPTITSRCEVLRLRPVSLETTAEGLQRLHGIPEAQARLLAHLSGGRPGLALHLHQHPERLEWRREQVALFFELLRAPLTERFRYAQSLSTVTQARASVLLWLSLWRDALIQASGSQAALTNLDQAQPLAELAQRLGPGSIYEMLARHERTLHALSKYANLRLSIENLLLHWPVL